MSGDGSSHGLGLAEGMDVSAPCRIRRVAVVLLAFVLLGATPVSMFAKEFPCPAPHHQCDAPSVVRCCCLEFTGGSVSAITEKGPERLSAPAMVAPAALMAHGAGFVFPPEAWFRVCSRAAGPPFPLHLLNVAILL